MTIAYLLIFMLLQGNPVMKTMEIPGGSCPDKQHAEVIIHRIVEDYRADYAAVSCVVLPLPKGFRKDA